MSREASRRRIGAVLFSAGLVLAGAASEAASSGFDAHRLWTVEGDQPGAGFGSAVASAGDVNGDGFPDLIVGAPAHDAAAGPGYGKVLVFYGSADGLASSPSWSAEGEQAGSQFGAAVGSAGDVNRDGFGDVVIGAPGYDFADTSYERDSGRLYVYLGSAQGLAATPVLVFDGRPYDLGSGRLGTSVSFGDFNGDGFSDVVGAEFARYTGGADVLYGSASGPSATNSWSYGPQAGLFLGSSVAAADLNGDGYDDLIVTSFDDNWREMPKTVVYLGSASGLPAIDQGWPPPGVPPDFSIDALENAASLGDLDADGYDDFVALFLDITKPCANHVVYRGSPSGPILAQQLGGVLGTPGRLARLGDVNGDGFTDLAAQDGSTFYLYLGSATGFRPLSDGMETLEAVLAGAGDVDRDGKDDLVAGDAAHERVDVYRGGTDWTFRVTGDVSVRQEVYDNGNGGNGLDITVDNAGPETVRVRLVDHFPPSINPSWVCSSNSSALVSAACLNDQYDPNGLPHLTPGDIDSIVTLSPGSSIRYSVAFSASLPVANTASLVSGDWLSDPDLSNNQSTLLLGPPENPLFADGFESGSTSAWSSSGGRGLEVLQSAALSGSFGLQVWLPVFGPAGVRDTSPQGESGYHARFQFDPNGFGGGPGAARRPVSRTVLFSGHAEGGLRPLFEVLIEAHAGQLALVARASRDDGSASTAPRAAIADAPHLIDVLWRRATGEGTGDGSFVLLVDGTVAGTLSGLDNDAGGGVDQVDLGLASRPLPGVGLRRTVFLDAFESWRLH